MAKKPYDKKMHLDMPFDEALERFVGTDPKQMRANIKRAKKKRPPGGKRTPSDDLGNVSKLRGIQKPERH